MGPFHVRVRCPLPAVADALHLMYAAHPVLAPDVFCDVTLDLGPPPTLRRWIRPQVQARFDGQPLFEPLPRDNAYALLEWTLNWWISNHAHQYLLLHAAVVAAPDGRAVVMPAPPGSGKSTLCAALVQRGWRLLSDEMAMVSLRDGLLHGMARPVSLKNRSIEVIRRFEPGVVIGEAARDTTKGTVAHLRPKAAHVAAVDVPARPAWVVFPRYVEGAEARLVAKPKADAMLALGLNAFNYGLLRLDGFRALGALVDACECHDFSYGHLDDAVAVFRRLADGDAGGGSLPGGWTGAPAGPDDHASIGSTTGPWTGAPIGEPRPAEPGRPTWPAPPAVAARDLTP